MNIRVSPSRVGHEGISAVSARVVWEDNDRDGRNGTAVGPPVLETKVGASAEDGRCDVPVAPVAPAWRPGRAPVPDELYLERLRELVAEAGGVVPSIREIVRRLSIAQKRSSGWLVGMFLTEQDGFQMTS